MSTTIEVKAQRNGRSNADALLKLLRYLVSIAVALIVLVPLFTAMAVSSSPLPLRFSTTPLLYMGALCMPPQ